MVELVDTGDLKSPEACRLVPVQVRLSPLQMSAADTLYSPKLDED